MKKIADFPESLQAPPEESPPSAETPPKEEKKEFPPKEEKKESPPGEEGAAGSPENPLSQFSREDLEAALLQLLTILKGGNGEMGMPEGAPEGMPPEVAPQEGMPPAMQSAPPEAALPPGGQPGLPPEMTRTAGFLTGGMKALGADALKGALPGAAIGAMTAPEGQGLNRALAGAALGGIGGSALGQLGRRGAMAGGGEFAEMAAMPFPEFAGLGGAASPAFVMPKVAKMTRTAGIPGALLAAGTGAGLGAYAAPEGRGWEGAALGGALGAAGGYGLSRLGASGGAGMDAAVLKNTLRDLPPQELQQRMQAVLNSGNFEAAGGGLGGLTGTTLGGITGGKLIPAKSPESVPSASFEDGTQLTPEQYQALLQQYYSEQNPTSAAAPESQKVAFPLGAALSSLGARAAAAPALTGAVAGGALGGLTAPEGQGWRNAAIGAAGGATLGHFGGKMLAGAKPGAATQAATHTPPVPQTAPTGEFASLVAKDAVPGGRLTDPRSATEHVQQLIAEGLPGVRTAAVQDLLQRVREAGTNKVASYMYDRQEIDIADAARILGVKLAYLTLKRKRIEQGIEAYSKVNAG